MLELQLDLKTADGAMPVFITHPGQGAPHPIVVLLMDGLGIREALRNIARRLAANGYYAMLPDLYYRAGPIPPIQRDQPGEWERMMSLVRSVRDQGVIRDIETLLEHAGRDAAAGIGSVGVMGFCMGGRLSLVVAQGLGARIAAAAGIHPGNLASEGSDSTHRNLDRVAAELYLAIADQDAWCTREQVDLVESALRHRAVVHEIEWHPGALHGFCVPGSEVYAAQAAERVWERVLGLFRRTLVDPASRADADHEESKP